MQQQKNIVQKKSTKNLETQKQSVPVKIHKKA